MSSSTQAPVINLAPPSPILELSFTSTQDQTISRYPPGIQQIINTSNKHFKSQCVNDDSNESDDLSTDDGREFGFGAAVHHILITPLLADNTLDPQLPAHTQGTGLNPQELRVMAKLSERVRVQGLLYTPQDKARSVIKLGKDRIMQLRDGLWRAIQEHWSSKIKIHCLEVPAYRYLRSALNKLLVALDDIAASLDHLRYDNTEGEIVYLTHQVKELLAPVVTEGERLLATWTRGENDQAIGQRLSENDIKHLRCRLSTSNNDLQNVAQQASTARVEIKRVQASRKTLTDAEEKCRKARACLRKCGIIILRHVFARGPDQ